MLPLKSIAPSIYVLNHCYAADIQTLNSMTFSVTFCAECTNCSCAYWLNQNSTYFWTKNKLKYYFILFGYLSYLRPVSIQNIFYLYATPGFTRSRVYPYWHCMQRKIWQSGAVHLDTCQNHRSLIYLLLFRRLLSLQFQFFFLCCYFQCVAILTPKESFTTNSSLRPKSFSRFFQCPTVGLTLHWYDH